MFTRPKNWMSGGLWKPKNPHSLEHLKYLYNVLCKNQTVTEQNKGLLVETLRAISEILIWGDQNDSSVFDFFLEKNMLAFFLRFMRQKLGRYICVQLLQLLNILFENISNETSVYYLLSNNYINSIIVHKFDFSDEEVMAYYISFLKTLSLKLNKHTVHFFYNEHTNDFALYTEAIKFFNHSESMVRIAVRTITLNVYRASHCDIQEKLLVEEKSMLRYIRDKTAAPYFSNLVWFIGSHVLEIDSCIRNDIDHNSRDRLADLVAEHLDHLHYLNDILGLGIDALNEVLSDHLLNRLLLPLYVYSLTKRSKHAHRLDKHPHVSSVVSLFLLSQVFLIMHHAPLVRQLADIIFTADKDLFQEMTPHKSPHTRLQSLGFIEPDEPLSQTLDSTGTMHKTSKKKKRRAASSASPAAADAAAADAEKSGDSQTTSEIERSGEIGRSDESERSTEAGRSEDLESSSGADAEKSRERQPTDGADSSVGTSDPGETEISGEEPCKESEPVSETGSLASGSSFSMTDGTENVTVEDEASLGDESVTVSSSPDVISPSQNSTDEEKLIHSGSVPDHLLTPTEFSLNNRPYFAAVFEALDCSENDYEVLFALCLLYALSVNNGINQDLLDSVSIPTDKSETKHHYNVFLVEKLITIISRSCQNGSRVRLATLELCILLMKSLVLGNNCYLQDRHLAAVEGAREEATFQLRNFYKSEEIFLDMFEDEHRELRRRPLNVEYLTMDASILLPPTGTPLTGIDFNKRLPCGEVERARRAIRVFYLVRELSLMLRQETETSLPLTKPTDCISVGDILDLNNSDLIACTVTGKDNKRERRFLVIDILQLILVQPDSRRLGWGIVKFVGFLQDVEVTGDKDDSRSLHVTLHRPPTSTSVSHPPPLLAARFQFDDHIRCMAAKQRLTKGRLKARQRKMQMIARLLEFPGEMVDSVVQSAYGRQTVTSPVSIVRRAAPREHRASAADSAVPGRSKKVSAGQLTSSSHATFTSPTAHTRSHPIDIQPPTPLPPVMVGDDTPSLRHSEDDVEEAEEARPSPEVQAFTSLNDTTSEPVAGAVHQEIPLNDMQGQSAEKTDEGEDKEAEGNATSTMDHKPCPKSLTPAKAVSVSLVQHCDGLTDTASSNTNSPKLLPPAAAVSTVNPDQHNVTDDIKGSPSTSPPK